MTSLPSAQAIGGPERPVAEVDRPPVRPRHQGHLMLAPEAGRLAEMGHMAETRHIAEILQHSMLDVVPPQVGGLEVAARYRPAPSAAVIGGDWHDVFPFDAGAIGVSIGDVCGKGIKAAAIMGRLRTAMEAIAADEPSPAMVLSKVNRMLCRLSARSVHEPGEPQDAAYLATALYGRLDPSSNTFVYAVAGHPGPIVIDSSRGSARLDEPEPNLPLGVEPDASFDQQHLGLPPAGMLLVFTDGLFERRDTPIDDSLKSLVQQAAGLGGGLVGEVADGLLAATQGRSAPTDDIALVLLSWQGPSSGEPDRTHRQAEPAAACDAGQSVTGRRRESVLRP